jgi:ribonuclease HI
MPTLQLYTDGSSSTVYKTGGWAVFIVDGSVEDSRRGSAENTTNNEMELTALTKALDYVIHNVISGFQITIYSDSAYLINCFEQKWYEKWKVNGWKGANKQPIKHQVLWQEIFDKIEIVKSANNLTLVKVAAHESNYGNNFADRLAVKAREELEAKCGY